MAYLFNDPTAFTDEFTNGFAAAYPQWVRRINGGVLRSSEAATDSVAVVIGGGSGHYPAFAGLVGPGLAHAAAMGNIFASPSAQQIHSVAKAAHRGGGVLLAFGNYAGDVLNFTMAKDMLAAEGIHAELLPVTDDVSSASISEIEKRRGVAGDLAVFKIAGAASESGADLAEVTRIASLANHRTRSFGVAFSGCTLPGADAPLFTVPIGRMAIGMGIHGEPGIGEADRPTADALAELLWERLLTDVPSDITTMDGSRISVILNGLGSVKTEELFVVYRRIAALSEKAGLTIVEPEIGEFATSFEMAGISLTLIWLDDELEAHWKAPASTPAFRKAATVQLSASTHNDARDDVGEIEVAQDPGSAESQAAAGLIISLVETIKDTVDQHVEEFGALDSIAGDGDHGIGMKRGSTAAVIAARQAATSQAGAGQVLAEASAAWADKAGGTSGILWGIILREVGSALGNTYAPSAHSLSEGLRLASAKVMSFGKAAPGDKTMVDVLVPFGDAFAHSVNAGNGLRDAWNMATPIALEAARKTADLVPKMGRARPLAEKSLGHPDPGAISLSLIIDSINEHFHQTPSL
ncbi:dihydroxyacetone kinase family protein [Paeniglutamicibacter sp. MACA_103]|uniref:dihydroxyacetone kinase family protein n=1 Tax=Paeniglutamicibacter sp. MACA_103 TaxID=3377337 RepID=UPI003894454E